MNYLMNLLYSLGVIGILAVGSWFVLQGRTEVGTIVAFISGLSRMNAHGGRLDQVVSRSHECWHEVSAYRFRARKGPRRARVTLDSRPLGNSHNVCQVAAGPGDMVPMK